MRASVALLACARRLAALRRRSRSERDVSRCRARCCRVAPDHKRGDDQARRDQGLHAGDDDAVQGARTRRSSTASRPAISINATLVVVSNDAYLTDVKKVGEAPLEKRPPSARRRPASSGFELLKPGEPVPDATFVDQDGKKRDVRRRSRDRRSSLTFIYTSCPLPTFCPLMDRHFAAIQKQLKADPALKDVHLVTRQLRSGHRHAGRAEGARARSSAPTRRRWTFLTGDRDEIDQVRGAVRRVGRARA